MKHELQGQRLMDYVNTKWEEMIHDWRAVYSKSSSIAIQHSVENEWMVITSPQRHVVRLSFNGLFPNSHWKCRAHGLWTARSSLPAVVVLFGSL